MGVSPMDVCIHTLDAQRRSQSGSDLFTSDEEDRR
jgi:hypothetical protein